MTKTADLHIHTFYSDSTSSPEEVVEQAHTCGLSCIAITDHDTIEGIKPTIEAAKKYGLEVISGVELSSEHNGKDIHMLGYLFNYDDEDLVLQLNKMQDFRMQRMDEMLAKLRKLGVVDISLDEVCALNQSKSVGRLHLATLLIKRKVVSSLKEAFDKYLSEEGSAYVAKYKMTPYEAIELIKRSGGVAVMAHPMLTAVDELIPGFVKHGMEGIEVHYPNVSENMMKYYLGLAKKYDLVVTGGSDAHGKAKQNTFVGKKTISYELVEALKARCAHA